MLEFVDDHLTGNQPDGVLADARNTVMMVMRELDALAQLGPPMPKRDYYADSL